MTTKMMPSIPFNRILTPVEHNNLKFLILDCPTDSTLPLYLTELLNRSVKHVVRVCEPTYNKNTLIENGIQVHDLPFKDGGIPSNDIILQFLALCDDTFGGLSLQTISNPSTIIPCIVKIENDYKLTLNIRLFIVLQD